MVVRTERSGLFCAASLLKLRTFFRLIGVWQGLLDGERVEAPFGSFTFLTEKEKLLSKTFSTSELDGNPAAVLNAMQAVVTHLLAATHERVTRHRAAGKSDFEARNESQFFLGRDLALAFIETTVLQRFLRHVDENGDLEIREKAALADLAYLFGLDSLQKKSSHLVKFGLVDPSDFVRWLHSEIVGTCERVSML